VFYRTYKKIYVHIIDSNSESDEEMSNTPPDIADFAYLAIIKHQFIIHTIILALENEKSVTCDNKYT
jgi:hypothetical protein